MTLAMGDQTIVNPPVMQVTLTLQFAPALNMLSIIDLSDFYAFFRDHYPVFKQVGRAGPMAFTPFEEPTFAPTSSLPRLAFLTADLSEHILFQNDRLSASWARKGPLHEAPAYPGFSATLERLLAAIDVLKAWVRERGFPSIEPSVGEVAYVDGFLIMDPETNEQRKLSDFFNGFKNAAQIKMYAVNHNWREPLPDGLEGYMEGEFSGPLTADDGVPIVTLDMSGAFNPGSDWSEVRAQFDAAHDALTAAFKRVVNPEIVATL